MELSIENIAEHNPMLYKLSIFLSDDGVNILVYTWLQWPDFMAA